ncbi:hypothetical protein [Desulfotomaculum sp. 1211_IL3151]|uniref:hypothetical protein n=1 Tax=Desulfotomaculum sp. 1211_IL3151 TaxID=3084055 RepID=UPI002FD9465F
MRPFIERLKSRKLIMALMAAVVAGTKAYYPDLPEDAVYAIVCACMGYVAIEGAVDAVGQLAKWLAEKTAAKPPDAEL